MLSIYCGFFEQIYTATLTQAIESSLFDRLVRSVQGNLLENIFIIISVFRFNEIELYSQTWSE